ncbi:MAG: hypothetical protein HY443_00885 [Candidatus Nealsonbacteria bacterium]|nr:hypothetical protein [Candidatus Nealsonbacteria bacterium]
MEKAIKQIEEDLDLLLRDQVPGVLRKELGDGVDLRAARLIILSLQWASVGYQSALRFAGAKFGQGIGVYLEVRELSLALESLKKIFEKLKWGKVEIEMALQQKKAILRIVDSLTSSGVPNINQNLCFFEEGFIEGCLEGVIKGRGSLSLMGFPGNISGVDVREARCVGQGASACEFEINLKS